MSIQENGVATTDFLFVHNKVFVTPTHRQVIFNNLTKDWILNRKKTNLQSHLWLFCLVLRERVGSSSIKTMKTLASANRRLVIVKYMRNAAQSKAINEVLLLHEWYIIRLKEEISLTVYEL